MKPLICAPMGDPAGVGPEILAASLADPAVADMATVPAHRLSLCVVSLGDLAEGDALVVTTAHWPAGQACRITTPVAPDAGGWARFDVVPE